MSELFSWPTVTVGMSPPCVNDDPPAPGCGAAAGRFRLLVTTGIRVALRVARRTRTTPGRVPWSAAGRPSTGHPSCSRRCAVSGARTADPDVCGISPTAARSYQTEVLGDAQGAVMFFTNTPQEFGHEIRGIAVVDIRNG